MLFSEPQNHSKAGLQGGIEVICGAMFSGKTKELIRRLRRAQHEKFDVSVFKPAIDTRYDVTNIVSHDLNSIHSTPVVSASAISPLATNAQVVGIDEGQFFDSQLPDVCVQLAKKGIRVIVAGLDMNFMGEPFGPMPALMAIADKVTKLHAVCVICEAPAMFSFRKSGSQSQILLGEKESYEPRCRICFNSS